MATKPAVTLSASFEPRNSPPDDKLLERVLEDQEGARKAFLRDLKLAFLVLLLFQFWILPRFVNLSDSIDANNRKIATLQTQDNALRELQRNLESLRRAVRRGADELAKRLAELPRELHGQT